MSRFKKKLRESGLWLSAEEALIIKRALERGRPIYVTEEGAEVIRRFYIRCEELKRG